MNRSRRTALAAWLGTLLAVVGLVAAALAAADLGTAVTVVLGAAGIVVALLASGAVLVALRPSLVRRDDCATGDAGAGVGCGACGQACLKAGASTGTA